MTPFLNDQRAHHDDHDRHDDGASAAGGLPSLAADRSVLARLHESGHLSSTATGHICDALLEWAADGLPWPDRDERPDAAPDRDLPGRDLRELRQVTDRLPGRIGQTPGVAGRLLLGRVGRHLQHAIASAAAAGR